MPSPSTVQAVLGWRFWLAAAYLAAVFLLGGGARDDIQSLVLLRPIAALVCGVALLGLTRPAIARHRALFLFYIAVAVWTALQLLPLPPGVWQALPGRALIQRIGVATGMADAWRPFSIDPRATANALAALLVPAPVLLLAAQLGRRELRALIMVLLGIGLVSVLLAVAQISSGAPYFYRITNEGAGVGLFANRNHQAAYLAALFPLLAVFAQADAGDPARAALRIAGAGAMAVILVPLILVTGSRAGLILGVLGIAAAAILWHRQPRRAARPSKRAVRALPLAAGFAAVAIVGLLAVVMARAEAVTRLFADDQGGDLRLKVWGPVWRTATDYLPLGSGSGSFVTAFKLAEPDSLVRATYLNHAHNDLLEVFVTDGLVGTTLMALAIGWLAWRGMRGWFGSAAVHADAALARAASALLALLFLASVSDYPLRVPSLACLAVLAALWLNDAVRAKPTNPVDVSGTMG